MNSAEDRSFEHVMLLRPGEEAESELRFEGEEGASVPLALASIDMAAGTAELVIDDLWGGYRMEQFVEDAGRWLPVWPAEDGDVHAVVRIGAAASLTVT